MPIRLTRCLRRWGLSDFIEVGSFKMIIPLDEKMNAKFTVTGGIVSDTVSGPVIDTVPMILHKTYMFLQELPRDISRH